MTAIQTQTATVYVGGGRRCFTKAAAYNAAAKAMMRAHCDHDREDSCRYCDSMETHDAGERWKRLRARLARWLRWRDERRKPTREEVRLHSAARLRAERVDLSDCQF